jgi:hypothetical protein
MEITYIGRLAIACIVGILVTWLVFEFPNKEGE